MLNKIAVILRGHKRTWEHTKTHLLSFFDFYAFTVDYYVILWDSPSINRESIVIDFDGKNLKHLIIEPIPQDRSVYNPWLGPCYLTGKISKFVMAQELAQGFRYDCVIDTRPDVCFKKILVTDHNLVPFPMSIGSSGVNYELRSMDDLIFLTDSISFNFWSTRNRFDFEIFDRFRHKIPCDHHSAAYNYAELYNHFTYQIPWFQTILVRPNVYQYLNENREIFDAAFIAKDTWGQMTRDEMRLSLEASNIPLLEYQYQVSGHM